MLSIDGCEVGRNFGRDVRSLTCEGYSHRAPYKIRKYLYPLHIIRPPTVNVLLCVQQTHKGIFRPPTVDALLNIHLILVSGVFRIN